MFQILFKRMRQFLWLETETQPVILRSLNFIFQFEKYFLVCMKISCYLEQAYSELSQMRALQST